MVDHSHWIVPDGDFRDLHRLGSGRFGEVWLVERCCPPRDLVAKRLCLSDADAVHFFTEIDVLFKIRNHSALCKGVGFTLSPKAVYTEYLPNGSLDSVFNTHPAEWNATTKSKAVFGIACALMHLHAERHYHRYLHPSNVMFDANWEVRVVDFGFTHQEQDQRWSNLGGHPAYIPPELLDTPEAPSAAAQAKADIWAFGMILYQIVTGEKPYGRKTEFVVQSAIKKGEKPPLPEGDNLLLAIIDNCISTEPEGRPEFFHVVQALYDETEPLFPGTDADQYQDYRERVFLETNKTPEALAVFEAPPDASVAIEGAAPARGIEDLRRDADSGNAQAQIALGLSYLRGRGVSKDIDQSVRYFRLASQSGSPTGMFHFAACLEGGVGIKQDLREAVALFKRSADGGVAAAVERYARALDCGRGVPENQAKALKYYKRGADLGLPKCQYYYARACLEGRGVPVNLSEALRYYRLGHNAAYGPASCDLATMLIRGQGVPVDLQEGVRIYEQAIAAGCEEARINLGCLLQSNTEVKNLGRAAELFRDAAAVGDLMAKVLWATDQLGGRPRPTNGAPDLPRGRKYRDHQA
jgi:TPR repeat protein